MYAWTRFCVSFLQIRATDKIKKRKKHFGFSSVSMYSFSCSLNRIEFNRKALGRHLPEGNQTNGFILLRAFSLPWFGAPVTQNEIMILCDEYHPLTWLNANHISFDETQGSVWWNLYSFNIGFCQGFCATTFCKKLIWLFID